MRATLASLAALAGNAPLSRLATITLFALRATFASYARLAALARDAPFSRFTTITLVALRPALSLRASGARRPRLSLRPSQPRLASITFSALRPAFSLRALRARLAALARNAPFSRLTTITLVALRTTLALRARGTGLAKCAIAAIAHRRQPVRDQLTDIAAQLDEIGAQFGDRRLRLRLDQHALALPLPSLGVEHLAERFAPSLKQTVGGVRSGRHWQKGFGPLVQCHRDDPLAAAWARVLTRPVKAARAPPGFCRPG